jgi:hypothetical protein
VSGNGEDYEIVEITIVDADGTSATYVAAENDLPVALTGPATSTLQHATLAPLLATLACLKAKSVCGVAPGAPAPAMCTAKVTTDPGCLNGIFVAAGCEDAWMTLTVPTAGAYEIQTVNCIESVGIELTSADGASILASAAPSPKPACASLTHTFDAAGTYRLVLQKRNAAGCAAGTTGNAGDFYVRVSPKL